MATDATQGQELTIEELKEKHGKLFALTIPTDGEPIELILKKVGRRDYAAGSKLSQKDEMQGVEYFLRALTVKGDVDTVIKDFELLRIAADLLIEVIGVKEGNVRAI